MTTPTTITRHWVAGMPQLATFGLSEDWALAVAMEEVWFRLAESLGQSPAQWRDAGGKRMYAAAIALWTEFDLARPMQEDDAFTSTTTLLSIRKPHALGETRFAVDGQVRATVRILTSFVRRDTAGSNKKFSRVRDVWQADELAPQTIDDLLADHHAAKTRVVETAPVLTHEVNRLRDFNAAQLLYFKNFVGLARTAEWAAGRGQPPRMVSARACYYLGNADDAETIFARVGQQGDQAVTEFLNDAGQRLFLSQATMGDVTLTEP